MSIIEEIAQLYAQRAGLSEENYGDEFHQLVVRDMLADLMHYADSVGVDFRYELGIAEDHYKEEKSGGN